MTLANLLRTGGPQQGMRTLHAFLQCRRIAAELRELRVPLRLVIRGRVGTHGRSISSRGCEMPLI